MRTRSQTRNRNRQQQSQPAVVQPFHLEEPFVNPPLVPMADNRTMAQLLQAPTEGYEDAIVIPEINANFELKHGLINLVQNKQFFGHDKEDPHAHILPARFGKEKEPPRSIFDDGNDLSYYDSEGDVIFLESLLSDDSTHNLAPEVISDHEPKQDESIHNTSITFSPRSDPLHHEFAGELITLPSRIARDHEEYLSRMTLLCEIINFRSQENVHTAFNYRVRISLSPVDDSDPPFKKIHNMPCFQMINSTKVLKNDDFEDEDMSYLTLIIRQPVISSSSFETTRRLL
ncbi:hypothetical protein Tco_1033275 [Tanacetum coccineum]|uniref:Reverse transcriptase domain-containing protein n=1 Tax=Tanacetum coccineum TaxID=301880 RepID=A0ABQ5GEF3_9ASTR